MKANIPIRTWLADHTIRRLFKCAAVERMWLLLFELVGWKPLRKLVPVYYSYPLGCIRRCCRWGVYFEVDIGSYEGWTLYYHRSLNNRISDHVHAGDVVFDIGANQGEVSLCCALKTGLDGQVYSFEPNPQSFARLKKNLELNPSLSCHVEQLALGSIEQTVDMRQPDGRNSGTATINSPNVHCGGNWTSVHVITLDRYVHDRQITRIDVMKIDVEGFELEVCRGAEDSIMRWHPLMIMELVDQHQRMHGSSARLVVGWLKDHGYSIIDVNTGAAVSPSDALDGCIMDILCTYSSPGA